MTRRSAGALGPPPSPVDELTGLVRWLLEIPVEPGEPRIFNCSVKLAETHRYLPAACYDMNGGAGLTREAARRAAIGEGLERYCASIYDADQLLFGRARELRQGHAVAPPADFALFHPRQQVGFPPFTDDTPLAWTWAFSLVRREPVLVPACLVYMPYVPRSHAPDEAVIAPAVSTGLACGRSPDAALLRGIYEAVERDAFMIAWLNRLRMPRVDLASSPALEDLYEARFRRDGLEYTLVDMTTDVPIPSFACILVDWRKTPPMVCVGGASSLDPVEAATKALVEAVQTHEWAKFIGREPDALQFAPDHTDIRDFERHVALYAFGDMLPAVEFLRQGDLAGSAATWRTRATGDTRHDLQTVVHLLAALGQDVLALDLTSPDVAESGYTATRVVIPGLQPLFGDHLLRFLGGSRLYQVPQRLGFTSAETTLEQLNPDPHPYP